MSERLNELLTELDKVFGRMTKWRALCKQHNSTTAVQQIKLAEEVLAEPCTGTVTEAHSHWLDLQGVKTSDLKDFLGRKPAKSRSKRGKRP